MKKSAIISTDERYRYALWRVWNTDKPMCMFIGLNPSTADAELDDPTIRRCIGFARSWGYGGSAMANLFAWRSTDPAGLLTTDDPVGPDNDDHMLRMANECSLIVAAWGNGPMLKRVDPKRAPHITALFTNLHCIKLNAGGVPAHPLYLKGNLQPVPLNQLDFFK